MKKSILPLQKYFRSVFSVFFFLQACFVFGLEFIHDGMDFLGVSLTNPANSSLLLASEELRSYAKKVTGVVVSESEKGKILIGTIESSQIPAAIRKVLEESKMADSFYIKTENGMVFIVGKTGVGALYGTYEFIEKILGVKWFFPGKDGERFQMKSIVTIPKIDCFEEPCFKYRIVSQVGSHGLAPMGREWAARNRLSAPGPYSLQATLETYREFHEPRMLLQRATAGGHDTFNSAAPVKKYALEHPEYFALVDGERNTSGKTYAIHHCISNPDVQELLYQQIISLFEKNGVANMSFLFGAPDTLRGWCECPECRKLDGGSRIDVSRRFHSIAQKIARRVWGKIPQAEIQVWAYWNYCKYPEGVTIDPRTVIYFCASGRCYAHRFDDPSCSRNVEIFTKLNEWMRVSKKIYIYEYGMAVPYNYEPYEEVLLADQKLYKKLGLLGRKEEMIFPDAIFKYVNNTNPWRSTLRMGAKWQFWYLFGKSSWNPELDFDQSIAEIEAEFYGKAYPAMAEYNALRRELWRETPGCIGFPFGDGRTSLILQKPGAKEKLLELLQQAENSAQSDELLLERIQLERGYLTEFWIKTNDQYRAKLGKRVAAPSIQNSPVIDGDKQEVAWSKAFYVSDFYSTFDKKKTPIPDVLATSLGILSDTEHLYFLIEAKEPKPAEMVTNALSEEQMNALWQDDSIELFIAPRNHAQKYYQIVVNSKGFFVEIEQPGTKRNIQLGTKVKSSVLSDRYIVEIKIPVNKMEGSFAHGTIWHVHMARNRKVKDDFPATGWSLDGTSYHALTDYRPMSIGDPIIQNGTFEEGSNEQEVPKKWSYGGNKKNTLVKTSSDNHLVKLTPGGDVRQIVFGKKFFCPQEPVSIVVTLLASGQGTLRISNARFSQTEENGKNKNIFIKTENVATFALSPEMNFFSCEYNINAAEFSQMLISVADQNAEAMIDDVAVFVK